MYICTYTVVLYYIIQVTFIFEFVNITKAFDSLDFNIVKALRLVILLELIKSSINNTYTIMLLLTFVIPTLFNWL